MRSHEFIVESANEKVLIHSVQLELQATLQVGINKVKSIEHNKLESTTPEQAAKFKKELQKAKDNVIKTQKRFADSMKEFSKFGPIIQNNCSHYLELFNRTGQVLYSGRRFHGALYQDESLEKRRPKDSMASVTTKFDSLLKKLGVKARRGNSIFTTSSECHAAEYGADRYIIIPFNDINFSWSETRDDLVLSSYSLKLTYRPLPDNMEKILKDEKERIERDSDIGQHYKYLQILEWLYRQNFYNIKTDLAYVKNKYPDSPVNSIADQLLKYKPKIDLNKFQEKFKINTTSMEAVLNTNHEILINGKYYGIHNSIWDIVKGKLFQ